MTLSDLWRWDGKVNRGPYLFIGVIGFAIKHNLDRLVASLVFKRPWSLFNYLSPRADGVGITALGRDDAVFFGTLLALALPFIWVGVALTLRRLRSIGLPTPLVVLFFLPVLNLVFFLLLSVLPANLRTEGAPDFRGTGFLDRLLPESALGSAALALLVTAPLGAAAVAVAVSVFRQYGWSVFVALPFSVGLASALLYGFHGPRGYWSCVGVSFLAVGLLGTLLFALAFEGLVCLMMAAPLGLVLAGIGGSVGYLLQRQFRHPLGSVAVLTALALSLPVLMGAESRHPAGSPLLSVTTAVDIDAAPEQVWQQVVSFAELPEPREWLFRLGIAYPQRATIDGRSVGAVRHCIFSTGSFVEPINVWEEPRRLGFSVVAQPPPMQEWTPYAGLHPPHLDDYLRSERGEFLLVPLGDGRTRLHGTTWYRHQIWPAAYWRLWSDRIIAAIHRRVLVHIKRLSEEQRGWGGPDNGPAAASGNRTPGARRPGLGGAPIN